MTHAIRSRRDAGAWAGRTDTNKRVVFDDVMIASSSSASARAEMGSYVAVRVDSSNGITLRASKLCYSSIVTKCIQRKTKLQTLNPESNLNVKTPSISCLIIQLQHHLLCCRPAHLSYTPVDAAATDADDGVASAS